MWPYLDPDSADGEEGGGVLLDLALVGEGEPLLLRGDILNPVEEGVVLGQHLVVVHNQAAQHLPNHTNNVQYYQELGSSTSYILQKISKLNL